MLGNRNKTKTRAVSSPSVRTGSKKGGGSAVPLTSYGPPRTFHPSASTRHQRLSSAVADTKLSSISKRKSGLNTVSPGMKQRVPPGTIDNGVEFQPPFVLSEYDAMQETEDPNIFVPGLAGTLPDLVYSPHQPFVPPPTYTANRATSHSKRYDQQKYYNQPSTSTSASSYTIPYQAPTKVQAQVKSPPQVHAQVQARPQVHAQAQAQVLTTAQVHAQAQAQVLTPAQAQVKSEVLAQLHAQLHRSSATSTPLSTSNVDLTNRQFVSTSKKSRSTGHAQKAPPSNALRKLRSRTKKHKKNLGSVDTVSKPPLSVMDPFAQMSFSNCVTAKSTSTVKNIPAFEGSVTTPRVQSNCTDSTLHPASTYGRCNENAIDILSSDDDDVSVSVDKCRTRYDSDSDDDDIGDLPKLVGKCRKGYDSESDDDSDEDYLESETECSTSKASYSSHNRSYSINQADYYRKSKRKNRRRKKQRSSVSTGRMRPVLTPVLTPGLPEVDISHSPIGGVTGTKVSPDSLNSNIFDPPESHLACSKIWLSSLCPKGICLVVQTESEVHLVQDCTKGQVYIFRQLTSIVHQQQVRSQMGPFLKENFPDDFPVLLYRNHRDYASSFLVILNNNGSISPIIDRMEFEKMNRLLLEVDPHNGIGCLRQAERSSLSYGYASSRCMRRGVSGTAIPALLKDTSDPFIQELFVNLSTIFSLEMLPSWAKYVPETDRLPFAESIAKDNLLEGLTIHRTSHDNLLQPHKDVHNPPYHSQSQLSLVVGTSQWVGDNRIGVTGYFRRSVTGSMKRIDITAPLLEELSGVYLGLPPQRRHLTPEMFELAHKDGCHLDEDHFTVLCSIDPMGFHALYIHSTCLLQHVFHLTFPQVLSVISCMDIFPNCAYFYDQAVYELIERKVFYHGAPLAIGHHLAIRMLHYRDVFYNQKRNSRGKLQRLGLYRFASHNSPILQGLPSPTEWIECVIQKFVVCLFIWKSLPTQPNLRIRNACYDSCSELFQSTVTGMGPLSAKHQMSVLSSIGCLPSWIRSYSSIEGRVLEFFTKRYNHLDWKGLPGRKTLTTIQTYFQNRFKEDWTLSRVENLLCKVFRILSPNGRDSTWVDIHREDQIIVLEIDSKYTIFFADGKKVQSSSNILCEDWEMIGSVKTNAEGMAEHFQIGNGFDDGKKFPTLFQLMQPIDINQVVQSFPPHQEYSSLSFSF